MEACTAQLQHAMGQASLVAVVDQQSHTCVNKRLFNTKLQHCLQHDFVYSAVCLACRPSERFLLSHERACSVIYVFPEACDVNACMLAHCVFYTHFMT